jgi:glycerophosphoryl diester phosphodiesterase
MLIIGHRGAPELAPENTLSSIQKALESGVDAIEIDVATCRTGEIVLMHDDRVDRMTDGTGEIDLLSFEELRRLTVRGQERIPTLQEVIALIDGRVPLNIEIKGIGSASQICSLLQQDLASRRYTMDDFMISSFNHRELHKVEALLPGMRISPLISCMPLDIAKLVDGMKAWSINIDASVVQEEFVNEAHAIGLKVLVYTVDFRSQFDRLESMGVDGIFTNNRLTLETR